MTNDAPDSLKIEEIFIIVSSGVLQKLADMNFIITVKVKNHKLWPTINCMISLNEMYVSYWSECNYSVSVRMYIYIHIAYSICTLNNTFLAQFLVGFSSDN